MSCGKIFLIMEVLLAQSYLKFAKISNFQYLWSGVSIYYCFYMYISYKKTLEFDHVILKYAEGTLKKAEMIYCQYFCLGMIFAWSVDLLMRVDLGKLIH